MTGYPILMFITLEAYPEAWDIFKRIGKVFEQTYTRFLDLQKAEAQARESRIQLALERVRARTMAMQKSDELSETAFILYQQFKELGEIPIQITIGIINEAERSIEFRITITGSDGSGTQVNRAFIAGNEEPTLIQKLFKAWKAQQRSVVIELTGKELKGWISYRNNISKTKDDIDYTNASRVVSAGFFSKGLISISTLTTLPDETIQLLERFASVFDQTYSRFLDLQKAEAQAREAQIEAALERVRSRSMGMQKSEELRDVIQVIYEQFVHLNIQINTVGFILDYKERDDLNFWIANKMGAPTKQQYPYFDSQHWNLFIEAKQKGLDFFADTLTFEEKNKFFQQIFGYTSGFPEEAKDFFYSSPGWASSNVLLKNVCLFIDNLNGIPFADADNATLMRFGKVFQQTYTRFLDLQKAEAQAREAQIEASLERVRASAMAMHHSEELSDVLAVLFEQFDVLNIRPVDVHLDLFDLEKNTFSYRATGKEGKRVIAEQIVDLDSRPEWRALAEKWKKGKPNTVHFSYYPKEVIRVLMTFFPDIWAAMPEDAIMSPEDFPDGIFDTLGYCKFGYMGFHHYRNATEEEKNILIRFANEFERLYQRFLDLQKAEAHAREAQIEAALERVRSRTLAMQKSDELAETSAVLFKQLIQLGIEPNRLYIGIIEDKSSDMEFWITDEDGSKVSIMFKGDAAKNVSMKKMYDGWKQHKKSIVIDMQGKELSDYFHYLGEELHIPFKGGLSQKRRWQYIAYFSKGLIGMASPEEQPEATLQLLERFASVFNLTFTRFNDLKIAEAHALQAENDLIEIKAARKKAEETLSELQATQKQLIQSEKMASLGELTAGIAHEIQNPLNFVNNFSEVSNELIDEMNEELNKGDIEEAKAISSDIKQNLEKINHHGKRAGDIVKGMLQHSRSSTGVKEPTDINALADEYLRLSYHGLRAKDKEFNATMKTDFDNGIGKINIIPQDIGRVLLNLYNNAFYAVTEKKKLNIENYEPTVSVSTKKMGDKVEVRVKDNGNGIPQKIVDKIFQPFFTTKPTGQGTGLGLSLSYDIIKAHGGEIKVNTVEGEFAEFVVQLPVSV